jgi:hypothetical protein
VFHIQPQESASQKDPSEGASGTSCATVPSCRPPWTLPAQGLAVFHGAGNTARLSHYFLPRLILAGRRALLLDGANSADPRLMARLARERGVEFREFSRRIQIARAFTCFQLTELAARVPRWIAEFPADVLIVTALPELYFDEDVRDGEARAAFDRGVENLRRWAAERLAVAVFSSAVNFTPSPARRSFFSRTCAAASEVWEFRPGEDGRPRLICTRPQAATVKSQFDLTGPLL